MNSNIKKIKKVRPVLKLVGSKYKMLDFLFENFNFNGVKNFFDIFGGTGIVGVNVKNNYPNIIVTINDYDNKLTKLNYYDVLENQINFNGYGRASEAAVLQCAKMIQNGLREKFDEYISILKKCNVSANDYMSWIKIFAFMHLDWSDTIIYFDPPYFDKKDSKSKFYKHNIAINEFWVAVGAVIKFSKAKVYISFCDDPQSLEWPRKNNFFEALNLRIIYKDKISIHTNNKAKKYREILITNVKEKTNVNF